MAQDINDKEWTCSVDCYFISGNHIKKIFKSFGAASSYMELMKSCHTIDYIVYLDLDLTHAWRRS